jgi:very-short-patch-repair endonuclease
VFVIPGAPLTWRAHLTIATFALGGRGVVSHRAAAALHGLDGVPGGALEITTPRHTRPRLDGFVVHSTDTLERVDVLVLDGIRVTSVARTLADLGAVCPQDVVWQAADDAVRRGASRRWLEQVLARVDRPGPSGTGALRRVLEAHRRLGDTDSFFETRLLGQLESAGLVGAVPQYPVRTRAGRLVAVVDIALPAARVAVEAHSKRFHFGDRRSVRDADRDHRLQMLRWDVVYVLHDEVDRGVGGRKVARFVTARRRTDVA